MRGESYNDRYSPKFVSTHGDNLEIYPTVGGQVCIFEGFRRLSTCGTAAALGVMKICGIVFILSFMSGCAAIPNGYADNSAGRFSAAKMCKSMRAFVRAPLDASGLRRAWFLPFGSYEDGSFDFYAPMASEPSDAPSKAFYDNKVGQLTHYLRAPEFAAALAGCLSNRDGYERLCQSQTEDT